MCAAEARADGRAGKVRDAFVQVDLLDDHRDVHARIPVLCVWCTVGHVHSGTNRGPEGVSSLQKPEY